MKRSLQRAFGGVVLLAALAACAGRSPLPAQPAPQARGSAVHSNAAKTTFWSAVVSEPQGTPLRAVPVRLMPWKPCTVVVRRPERLRCPHPVAQTVTAANGRFLLRAYPGHYLLVIGNDDPVPPAKSTPWVATVHDNLTLPAAKGLLHLLAPEVCTYTGQPHCLPPIQDWRWSAPERDGDYRLATLEPQETACVRAYDRQRERRGLVGGVVDEWITENVREIVHRWRYDGLATPEPVDPNGGLTTASAGVFGGSTCASALVRDYVMQPNPKFPYYAIDPQTLWFGARYDPYTPKERKMSATGFAEFPIDPRTGYKDPLGLIWP